LSKKISLVLGSGGARGLAHIGAIRWLEANGYEIASLVGCSMGACVGGIHAIGKLDEYEQWVRAIRKRDIVALMDLTLWRGGLLKGDRLFNTLRDLLGDHMIEDLAIKFTAVAVDINKSKEVWINHGPVFDAIRASVSIPLLFTPADFHGRRLIELQERIGQFLDSLSSIRSESRADEESITDVVYTAYDAMQSTIARQKLAAYPPDVLIDIPRNVANIMEFDRADELIELGFEATDKAMRQYF